MLNNEQLQALMLERRAIRETVSEAEWAARVELAACYRMLAHFRMTDWIYNHVSSRVPGSHDHYLINPFGLLYEEITASSLVKVDVHGQQTEASGFDVNPAAFVIHGAIHQARPDIGCVLHTHSSAGVAVAAQAHGLLPISQHAFKVLDLLAYHDFEGIALDRDEQQRLIEHLGEKDILILRNHGLLTTGATVSRAFERMMFLERACQIQVAALAGGTAVTYPSSEVSQRTSRQFAMDAQWVQERDWLAMIRLLDRIDPSYRL